MVPHLRTEDNSLGVLNSELPEGPPTLLYGREYMVKNPRRKPPQPQLGKWALPPHLPRGSAAARARAGLAE